MEDEREARSKESTPKGRGFGWSSLEGAWSNGLPWCDATWQHDAFSEK